MASVRIKTSIELINSKSVRSTYYFDNLLSNVNEIFQMEFDVAADGTQIIWDPTNWTGMQISAFDRMILFADSDIDVELTVNEGDANEELSSFRIIKDIPFVLGADDAYYNHSASDAFAGSLDVIDKIRVDEPNSAATKVTLILVD
jgi:hypothetical protein